ncbi:hypothetical protein [Nitrosopumilus sp.]|uniref:hypothetical protein n=1 Tax=Nitrosopumilus sp. TaxID=2024843 RepID=UPI00261A5C25|nr:hypothetical protein [Nitrosopumilus sp.]
MIDYSELSKQVLNLYPQVKFAGIVNTKGELVAGGPKNNVEQILTKDESKMSMHYAIQKRELYTNLAYKIGKERSAITEFEKAALVSIPLNSNELFLIRTEIGVDYQKIVNFVYSKIDSKNHIREEIKSIQEEIAKLKNLKQIKKKTVKRKPARKSATKKKTVKRKPARKSATKKKTVKRKKSSKRKISKQR